jgi:hypothetical protein
MRRMLLLIMFAALLLISCNKDNSIVQTHQYNERSSGDLSLTPVNAIVIQNQLGPVIIDGSSNSSRVAWFLDKWVTAESQSAANPVFSQILVSLQTSNDTAYVSVQVPSGTASFSSLLSLTLSDNIPCILRKVTGTTDVSYLQSSFVGENVTGTTIKGHQGDCFLTGSNGDVSLEISLPDSGLCLVNFITGNITLRIPAATSSMLSAQTGNGTILYSALVIGDSVRTDNSLTGKLGAGRGHIQLSTGTGNIVITGF